jgi:hypothetical protein
MGRTAVAALVLAVAGLALALTIFLADSEEPRTLKEAEAKRVLEQLPYRLEFRPVPLPPHASGAISGRATGPGGAVVRFGVALGRGTEPVRLGPGSGIEATGGETFRLSDDATVVVAGRPRIAARLDTMAEWKEAVRIVVDIEEQLCRATTGKSCTI